jgi:hypothetical protein
MFRGEESLDMLSVLEQFVSSMGEEENDCLGHSSEGGRPFGSSSDMSLRLCDGKNDLSCSQAALSLLIKVDKVHG